MFEIWQDQSGVIHLKGMFVAGKSREAEELLDGITESTVLDFQYLKYISSSGLGILIKVPFFRSQYVLVIFKNLQVAIVILCMSCPFLEF